MPGKLPAQLGDGLVEYALLISLIALVVLAAAYAFGTLIHDWFNVLVGRILSSA